MASHSLAWSRVATSAKVRLMRDLGASPRCTSSLSWRHTSIGRSGAHLASEQVPGPITGEWPAPLPWAPIPKQHRLDQRCSTSSKDQLTKHLIIQHLVSPKMTACLSDNRRCNAHTKSAPHRSRARPNPPNPPSPAVSPHTPSHQTRRQPAVIAAQPAVIAHRAAPPRSPGHQRRFQGNDGGLCQTRRRSPHTICCGEVMAG
jgi:hypothetical protein